MSNSSAWECQCSVDCDVPVSFAWQYMTDISNWSDPPAEFALDGPFANGSRGTTLMPGRPPASWVIRDLDPGKGYTIEGGSFLDRAYMLCHWRFDPLPDGRTRLTQRLELLGENAASYVDGIREGFEPHLEAGMRNIAARMMHALSEPGHSIGIVTDP
jgi:polyketide cyclase/dehydrase/lipid transport protein